LAAAVQLTPMPVRIETDRLILTPEELDDADWLTELFNARGAQRFTVEDARERIVQMQSMTAQLGIGVLVLRTREAGEPLGYCGIVLGRGSLQEPELAYELLPRAHGRGYATEAAGAVLDAAFATGRTRIWATVAPWNAPSFRVLEKLGFRRDHAGTDDRGEHVWMVRDG
jgi:RimJ/RimL family protein N-acetyltransferase